MAYRSIYEGSFFINAICEVFQQNAETSELNDLLLKVNRYVKDKNPNHPSMSEIRNNRLVDKFKFEITEEGRQQFAKLKHAMKQKTRRHFY